jgi:hypothetical protein
MSRGHQKSLSRVFKVKHVLGGRANAMLEGIMQAREVKSRISKM